jgi:hypothetical protein
MKLGEEFAISKQGLCARIYNRCTDVGSGCAKLDAYDNYTRDRINLYSNLNRVGYNNSKIYTRHGNSTLVFQHPLLITTCLS